MRTRREAAKALVYFGDGHLASLSAKHRAELVARVVRFKKTVTVPILSRQLDA